MDRDCCLNSKPNLNCLNAWRLAMEGVRRWLVNISGWNPSEQRFESLLSLLPPQHRSQVTRFLKLEDRNRALVSQLLQYSLVSDVLRIPFDRICIIRTAEGKPYLKNEEEQSFANFNYSVSHHGDFVGIACEPVCLVGFDIVSIIKPQMMTTLQYLNNFMPYLTPIEWDNILRADSSKNMLTEFYRYWCLKESYVKAIGAGVGFGLKRLEFHHENWVDIYICVDGIRSPNWRFWIFYLENKHMACVAKGHPREAIDSYRVTLSKDAFDEDEYRHAVDLPEPDFISVTVDELVVQI